jgi:hypothetical protein
VSEISVHPAPDGRRPRGRGRWALYGIVAASLAGWQAAALAVPPAYAHTGSRPAIHYRVIKAAPQDGGGEPSLMSTRTGILDLSYPASSGTPFYRSTDGGTRWVQGATADSASGDDCLASDQAGTVYLCNLAGSHDTLPLQADVWHSANQGRSWSAATGVVPGGGASSQPFAVDRPWVDAWVPPHKTAAHALVALEYHDFGPSQIWVNISTDGGRTFGAPTDVIATSPQAEADSFCNTVPAGVRIVRSGPHAGRIYVAWVAADVPSSLATGCNITQLDTFHDIWVAWSDNGGASWTSHLVFDGGLGHDTSTPFVGFTLDDQGNPYVAFADNLGKTYDMYVEASFDGGKVWNGSSTGAGKPYLVGGTNGTHFFPTVTAGSPGHVAVAYLATPSVIKTLPTGKEAPGGGAGDRWYLYTAISNQVGTARDPRWTVTRVTAQPMHVGDICNLGIFCVSQLGSNRDLLDFISAAVDPAGRVHVAFTDDYRMHEIEVANEVSGPSLYARR